MIHHITRQIPPALLERCIAFYGVLGFEPAAVPETLQRRAVWLAQPGEGQQLHLMPIEGAAPEAGHFALICPDYEATVEALRGSGVEVEPRREHWGAPRCYARDPAGNVVELMAWPPSDSRE